jgi:hypothetical protein
VGERLIGLSITNAPLESRGDVHSHPIITIYELQPMEKTVERKKIDELSPHKLGLARRVDDHTLPFGRL